MKYHVTALAMLLFVACGSSDERIEITELAIIKPAPSFTFTNFDGTIVTDEDFRGVVYIAYFFFTSCSGPCPLMNSKANVLQATFSRMDDFRIIGFTVDPDTDTPQRLSRYADRYNARAGRWYMARMALGDVADVASGGFMMGDVSEPELHSTRFALVDGSGIIRGYYDAMDERKLVELRAAITHLLEKEHA